MFDRQGRMALAQKPPTYKQLAVVWAVRFTTLEYEWHSLPPSMPTGLSPASCFALISYFGTRQ